MSGSTGRCSLQARWLFTTPQEVVENQVLEIDEGLITDIHQKPYSETIQLDDCCITPSFVNAHAHLEFSDLAEPFPVEKSFTGWVRNILQYREKRRNALADLVMGGLFELRHTGSAAVADILTGNLSPADYRDHSDFPVSSVVFRELIGLLPESHDEQIHLAVQHLEQFHTHEDDPFAEQTTCTSGGLSPHAPYTVQMRLFEQLANLATSRNVPVAFHLAETKAELQLLKRQKGEFRDLLEDRDIWSSNLFAKNGSPLDYLQLLRNVPQALIVHGNYLNQDELQYIANHPNMTLVYCPRTHHYFGHSVHPWEQLLKLGGRVAIGTDGRSSNPDLSMWNELRFLKEKSPRADDQQLLHLGTQAGAKALNLPEFGSLKPGASASLNIIRRAAPARSLFAFENDLVGTMIRGQWIHAPV
ncbi:Aminodeoxyfutalosine deaminase [Polystyrenella longa]|uniref:Aminodeoxyfutalosine deaminase n=1 Tax=Polystyrenella longa TaxID=2528007 RepID=A0A518CHL9_9PLAN|nr:amidohydrolase family protein [Polystyrenella longa]QDU78720.1 Aminodeoxyfutalosine deaminase [Polystyrenella longa]